MRPRETSSAIEFRGWSNERMVLSYAHMHVSYLAASVAAFGKDGKLDNAKVGS